LTIVPTSRLSLLTIAWIEIYMKIRVQSTDIHRSALVKPIVQKGDAGKAGTGTEVSMPLTMRPTGLGFRDR
jgi:hypothetical protein